MRSDLGGGMLEMTWFIYGIVAAVGLCIGSFLNVCIYRLPHGKSVVAPPSACPQCRSRVAWYDNIPVLSYLILGGKCRSCKLSFSARYPAIELLTGAVAVFGLWHFGVDQLGWWSLWFISFVAPMLVVIFIDLDHQIIPDVITLPGIIVGLVVRAVTADPGMLLPDLTNSAIGILAGGGILYAIAWTYLKLRGQEGMGGGDIKLAAMFGAFLGWEATLWILFLSSFLGSIIGGTYLLVSKKGTSHAIPFGPFMVAAAFLYFFCEAQLWDLMLWYQLQFI